VTKGIGDKKLINKYQVGGGGFVTGLLEK